MKGAQVDFIYLQCLFRTYMMDEQQMIFGGMCLCNYFIDPKTKREYRQMVASDGISVRTEWKVLDQMLPPYVRPTSLLKLIEEHPDYCVESDSNGERILKNGERVGRITRDQGSNLSYVALDPGHIFDMENIGPRLMHGEWQNLKRDTRTVGIYRDDSLGSNSLDETIRKKLQRNLKHRNMRDMHYWPTFNTKKKKSLTGSSSQFKH